MTIQDAINSNKPFRRLCCFGFMRLIVENGYIVWEETKEKAYLPAKDLLKNDWIIEPYDFSCTKAQPVTHRRTG